MSYHMLRMLNHEKEVSRKLFEKDYIIIGYSDFDRVENWDFINKYKQTEDKKKLVEEMVEKCKWESKPMQIVAHRKINKFFEFKIGDIVLVPDTRSFHIVEIVDSIQSFHSLKENFLTTEDYNRDIGFVYKIKKVKNNKLESAINREKYAEAPLIARLKNLNALLNIDDLSSHIEKSKESFLMDKSLKIEEILKENLRDGLIEYLVKSLSPTKFERLLLKIMEKLGATCDIPSKNNKNNAIEEHADVDVVCIFEKLKHIIYIQAKFHTGKSNDWAIDQLDAYDGEKDLDSDYTTSYWAVTTGVFDEEAIESAKAKNIRLIDKYELASLILDIGVEGL